MHTYMATLEAEARSRRQAEAIGEQQKQLEDDTDSALAML